MERYACNSWDLSLILGLGRSPGEGNGYQLQYSGLENSMDRGDRQATVHQVTHDWATFTFTFRYADDITLMAENKEELKSVWIRVEEQSGKAGLKFNIQKMKIMASGSIISRQIDGEKIETVTDFTFLGSKSLWMVTAAKKLKDACSWEEKVQQT